jgi:hypothetical protein
MRQMYCINDRYTFKLSCVILLLALRLRSLWQNKYTGCFVMFSMITTIYDRKDKGQTKKLKLCDFTAGSQAEVMMTK